MLSHCALSVCPKTQHNFDLTAAAACAPHELALPIALRLGRDISAQLADAQGDLDLADQRLGDAAVSTLAAALATNTAVTSISLGDNRMGDAGAASLIELLKTNTNITSVALYANEIADAALTAKIGALCEVRVCMNRWIFYVDES